MPVKKKIPEKEICLLIDVEALDVVFKDESDEVVGFFFRSLPPNLPDGTEIDAYVMSGWLHFYHTFLDKIKA